MTMSIVTHPPSAIAITVPSVSRTIRKITNPIATMTPGTNHQGALLFSSIIVDFICGKDNNLAL